MGARPLNARELLSVPAALAIPAAEPEGIDVVETPDGQVWLRFVSGGRVCGMNPCGPDDLTRIGTDLIAVAEIARQRGFKRALGIQN